MGCACKNKDRKVYTIKLPGGLKITKTSEAAALAFAAKHPGSTIQKPAA